MIAQLLRNIPELDSIDIESIENDLQIEPDHQIWFGEFDMSLVDQGFTFIETKYMTPLVKLVCHGHNHKQIRFNFMNYFWNIYHEIPLFMFDYVEEDVIDQWNKNILSAEIIQILDYHRIVEIILNFVKMYFEILKVKDLRLNELLDDDVMPTNPNNIYTFDTKIYSPQLYHGHIEYLCELLDAVIPQKHNLNQRLKRLLRYHQYMTFFIE